MIVSHVDLNGTPPPPAPPVRSQTLATSTVLSPPSPSIAKVVSTADFVPASFKTIPSLPSNIDFRTDVWNQLKARNQCNISAVVYVISSYTNLLEKDFERRKQIEELHTEINRLRASHQGTHANMRVSISSPALAPIAASPSGPPSNLLDSKRLSLLSDIPSLISHSALLENVFNYLQKEKWATYILSLEFKNFTDITLEFRFKIAHGKMQHRGERYLKGEQIVFIPPGKSEVLSFGKGDHTAYGVEVTGRLLSLHGDESEIAGLVKAAMGGKSANDSTSASAPNLSSLTSSTIKQVVLHEDLYWYIPYKTARPCEFRDESKLGLDIHCLPARSQRNLLLKCMMFTYQFQWPTVQM